MTSSNVLSWKQPHLKIKKIAQYKLHILRVKKGPPFFRCISQRGFTRGSSRVPRRYHAADFCTLLLRSKYLYGKIIVD